MKEANGKRQCGKRKRKKRGMRLMKIRKRRSAGNGKMEFWTLSSGREEKSEKGEEGTKK